MLRLLDPEEPVLWPVKVYYPSDEGDGAVKHETIKVLFKTAKTSQLNGDELSLLRDHVKGWENIVDQHGNAVAYSPDMLNALLEVPYLAVAFMVGLTQCSRGYPAKN